MGVVSVESIAGPRIPLAMIMAIMVIVWNGQIILVFLRSAGYCEHH